MCLGLFMNYFNKSKVNRNSQTWLTGNLWHECLEKMQVKVLKKKQLMTSKFTNFNSIDFSLKAFQLPSLLNPSSERFRKIPFHAPFVKNF